MNGQGNTTENSSYFKINNAFYIDDDNATSLDNWIEQGLHVLFASINDSLTVSIDIGGHDKVYFMGMAIAIDNPGFIEPNSRSEFYHWIFISHIKEGLHDAYIHKEYVDDSLEKFGHELYFINILFPDQTEFQFYGVKTDS